MAIPEHNRERTDDMTRPLVGEKAPLFSLPNQDNSIINVADSLGQFVVIYFYPKALTPGCTAQACDLRDNWKVLEKQGITVFGISPDAPNLLRKFKDVENLPFDLLSDREHMIATIYDTWQEKSMYGRKYMGMMRDSFILSPDGTVINVLQKIQPAQHVKAILDTISKYQCHNS